MKYLTQSQARNLVEDYMKLEKICSTQEILDCGFVPRLEGYKVQPGKVSDSIYGGKGSYIDKDERVEFENPPLETKEGVPIRIMVRTQRISTHDINRGEIPFKDQVLAMNHNYMRRMVEDEIGTSQFEVDGLDDNSVVIAAENLKQIPFENVLRDYMAKSSTSTSLYQYWLKSKDDGLEKFMYAGHECITSQLIPNGPLEEVLDTPSTKSDEHDETVSPKELFDMGICTPKQYFEIRDTSIRAFEKVSKFLEGKRLILVDTKTEHGINHKGEIVSQDELYTMDSSRFWNLDDYKEQAKRFFDGQAEEINPISFSKEFARGFSEGEEGYKDEQRIEIAVRYIEGIQHLLGKPFNSDMKSAEERIIFGMETIVDKLVA